MSHFRRQCQFRLVKKFGQEIGHEIGAEWSRSTKRPLQYCWRYKNNVTALASTSSRISVGTDSTLLPPRAPRSSTRGWSQRTTPLVFIPVSGTAKPIRRANSPPLVMGRIIGSLVAWLNAVGENDQNGTPAPLFIPMGWVERHHENIATAHSNSPPTDSASTHCRSFAGCGLE